MMKKRKLILTMVLILGIILLGSYSVYVDKEDKLIATGTVEVTKYDVTPRMAGYIRNLTVKEGDKVSLNDFICELEREDLKQQNDSDWQAVAEATAKLYDLQEGARQQEIAMAKNSMDKAQVVVNKAKEDLKRNQELYAVGGISKQTLDDLQQAYDVACEDLRVASENYDLVVAGSRKQQIIAQSKQVEKLTAQAKASESILADTKIYSPVTGVVISKNFENNEYIKQGQAILTLVDLTDCWVIVYVSIEDLGKVWLSQTVKLQIDAYPEEIFTGTVIKINDEAEFTPRETLTKDERNNKVFAVKIQIPNENQKIKAGMITDVIFDD